MKPYIDQHNVTIKTCSPVFIGSGKQIGKKEYLYDRNSGSIFYIDIDRMSADMRRRGLSRQYDSFLMDTQESDLAIFLRKNGLSFRDAEKWSRHSEKIGDSDQSMHSVKNIEGFIKDAYGQPYVPGSSIKGMLRTMMETVWYLEHQEDQSKAQRQLLEAYKQSGGNNRNNYLKQEEQYLREKAFHRNLFPDEQGRHDIANVKNDMLRGIRIGDSEPLSYKDMVVCQKVDIRPDGVEKPFPLMRECIRPGTEIHFQVTIDPMICPYTFPELIRINEIFFKWYQEIFTAHFPEKYRKTRGNKTTFFLGGGAGYVSKTCTSGVVTDDNRTGVVSVVINNTLPLKIQEKHGHNRDERVYGVSPHTLKCTIYKGNYYQMGACYLVTY